MNLNAFNIGPDLIQCDTNGQRSIPQSAECAEDRHLFNKGQNFLKKKQPQMLFGGVPPPPTNISNKCDLCL